MDMFAYVEQLAKAAKSASFQAASASAEQKNKALLAIADLLLAHQNDIMIANRQDIQAAEDKHLEVALLDRLRLDEKTIASMAEGVRQIATLPDPIGEMNEFRFLPSGIQVGKMRVPLGVIGIIYESRPNVTADAAALCIKSGNACILRGGSEALNSNQLIAQLIYQGLTQAGLPETMVRLLEYTDRDGVSALLQADQWVDVIVPRGGKGLVKRISEEARVPVIKHLDGVCHVYIDQTANLDKALAIAVNAKTSRYGTCNTMETLLIHQSVAVEILPRLQAAYAEKGVQLRGCEQTCAILPEACIPAVQEDWFCEYLAPILSIKVVDDVQAAIAHINHYGSHHTDAIVSEHYGRCRQFLREVDSASVMVNASTRFADGFEYGLGAEIGISTDKIHARGPVGLQGLTSQKWIVLGDGQIRL